MEKFPIFRKKLFYAEWPNSCDFGIKIFFLQLFESGKFSTKVEKFPLCIFGLKFGKREGPEPENKISPKWKIFHQKWKNFHLCRMFQFMWFWNTIFFLEIFRSGKFSTKVERMSKLIASLARLARVARSLPAARGFETRRSNFLMLAYVNVRSTDEQYN